MFFSAKFFLYPLIAVALFFACDIHHGFAQVIVNLSVEGCNNNNICESGLDENDNNCSNDCTPCNSNNVCEALKGESESSCPLDCRPTSPSRGGGGTLISQVNIFDVSIETSPGVAIVSWKTRVPAFGLVQWGSNADYSSGSIHEIGIKTEHSVSLNNLEMGKEYFYQITSSLPSVFPAIYRGSFISYQKADVTAPANISKFSVSPLDQDLLLSWVNPNDADFAGVKILRSPFYFPISIEDGRLVYDGAGVYARDSSVKPATNYFYTAYSYDRNGNTSSGALLKYLFNAETVTTPTIPLPTSGISLSDFSFVQNDFQLPLSEDTVLLYPFHDISVSVSKNIIPRTIKLVILEIQSPYSNQKQLYKFYSFLDKERLLLKMTAFDDSGMYPFKLKFVDYLNNEKSEISGTFNAFGMRPAPDDEFSWSEILNLEFTQKEVVGLLLILAILALVAILPLLSRRRS